MDKNIESIILKRINRTAENLKKNNMDFYYAPTKEDVKGIVKNLLKNGDVVTHGGSMTLKQCGITSLLNSGDYKYIDRSAVDEDKLEQVYRASFSADVYLTSANAITESGVLYNVDGNSNRIAAIAYGPKTVIVVAGYNKIVKDLDEAILRVKRDAAPPNCQRLGNATYCFNPGECVSIKDKAASEMCDGCSSDDRICCNYLVSAFQRHKGRIKVIIVGDTLGY